MNAINHIDILQMFANLAKLEQARIAAAESVQRALPEGTEVTWEIRRLNETYLQRGHVVSPGDAMDPGRIIVRNAATGKTTPINVSAAYGFSVDGILAP